MVFDIQLVRVVVRFKCLFDITCCTIKSITNTGHKLAEHCRPGNITYWPPPPKRLKVLINNFFVYQKMIGIVIQPLLPPISLSFVSMGRRRQHAVARSVVAE